MNALNRTLPTRRSEIVAAFSVAMDYGMGMPVEFAMTVCLLSMRVGDLLGLSARDMRQVYYQALLSNIGCNVESQFASAIAGDEIRLRREFPTIDSGRPHEIIGMVIRLVRDHHAGEPALSVYRSIASSLLKLPGMPAHFSAHCEVAERLAQRLGFEEEVAHNLTQTFERWDGKGLPGGLKQDAISVAVQVVSACRDALLICRLDGPDAALDMLKRRRGGAYAPAVVDSVVAAGAAILHGVDDTSPVEHVLSLDPDPKVPLSEDDFDSACESLADFVDIKTTYTVNHSRRVADVAASAANLAGLASESRSIWRAGLLHELGRTGIPVVIWNKPGSLTARELEQVRLAPYFTERILATAPELARIGTVATLHQERLDGSGYYRRLTAPMLPMPARILQAADVACAMTEERPHRSAHSLEEAATEIIRQVKAGALDGDAAKYVLAALGARRPPERTTVVGGLTGRELDVLRLVAHGKTMKAIANDLTISVKTVDRHIQNIYTKINVSTRAAATLFALERHLL